MCAHAFKIPISCFVLLIFRKDDRNKIFLFLSFVFIRKILDAYLLACIIMGGGDPFKSIKRKIQKIMDQYLIDYEMYRKSMKILRDFIKVKTIFPLLKTFLT